MRFSSLIQTLAVAATLTAAPWLACAQTYPAKPIKIVVPAPPGGAIDLIARVVGDKLTASMGQPVIIDNKPGASNNLGTEALAKSAPDGYTIGIVGGSHNINKFLFKNLGWDPETSFEPIVYTHEVPLVFAIYPQIPARTLPEFIAWMKANPEQAKVATSGRGSAQEMAAEMFRAQSGVNMLLVPYKGSSAAQPDLIGGRTYTLTAPAGVLADLAGNAFAGLPQGALDFTTLGTAPVTVPNSISNVDLAPTLYASAPLSATCSSMPPSRRIASSNSSALMRLSST